MDSTTTTTLYDVRARALQDLWAYFDEMVLDLEDKAAPPQCVAYAREQRDDIEGRLLALDFQHN